MKSDIPEYIVEDIAVAVIREVNELNETVWNTYLINLKNVKIEGVLVTSTGYGMLNNEVVKTSTLRHFLDTVPPRSFSRIEPIMENVFGIHNEYWVSFYVGKVLYDKKYVFLAESIREENFTRIPIVNKRGVMIK